MLHQVALLVSPLLAQDTGGRGYTVSWAIILLAVILAIVVALRPAKREIEIRKPRDLD